ncbi:membrane protein [Nocardioides sp. AN3]
MTATRATSRPASRVFAGPKVPEVFVVFWVVKLLTTGIGETAADFMGTANLVLAGVVGIGGFFAALWLQLRADRYRPVLYWVTVLMVAVFGTMIADGPHVALGTPYYVDSALYLVLLIALLTWWRRSEGTLSVHSITTARRERFYWGTVLMTFGLGTALGDTTAQNLHMGFAWSIVLFAALMLVPLAVWVASGRRGTAGSAAITVVTFWAAYSLTRPLGASVADWMATKQGLGWGTGPVTAVGLLLFALLVGYVAVTHSDEEGAHEARQRRQLAGSELARKAGDRTESVLAADDDPDGELVS